jgi:hypothetical protein
MPNKVTRGSKPPQTKHKNNKIYKFVVSPQPLGLVTLTLLHINTVKNQWRPIETFRNLEKFYKNLQKPMETYRNCMCQCANNLIKLFNRD